MIVLLYIVLIVLTGLAILRLLATPSRNWPETLGTSFAMGCGALGYALFLLSLAGQRPSRAALIVIAIVAIAIILRVRRVPAIRTPPLPSGTRWDSTIIALAWLGICLGLINVLCLAVVPGSPDIDSFAIWLLKARILFLDPLHPLPAALLNPALSYSHQDYPLLWPSLLAGLYAAVGNTSEAAAKWLPLLMYAALLAIIHAGLSSVLRRHIAIGITALLSLMPTLIDHAGMAVAEVPLLLLHGAAVVYLLLWMHDGNPATLLLSAIFAAWAAMTKNEGLALLPLTLLAAGVFIVLSKSWRQLRSLLLATALAVLLTLPWLILRHHLPNTHEDYGSKLTSLHIWLANLPQRRGTAMLFLAHAWTWSLQGPIWTVLVITAVLTPRAFRRNDVRVLWSLLVAHLGLYMATFIVTPWDVGDLIPMISPKLLMHAAPLAALLIGLHWREMEDSMKFEGRKSK